MLNITFVALGSEQLAISLFANMAKKAGHNIALAYNVALFHDRFNLEIPWLNKIFDDTPNTIEQIKLQKPDVIFFSCLTATYQWMLMIAEKSKALFPDVKIVFGGVHPSAVPNRVISRPQIDFVVVGEGEVCFLKILEAIESNDYTTPIPNTIFKRINGEIIRGAQQPFFQHLDTLPPFTKEIWEPYIFIPDHYKTMTSRGCPYRCTFCFNNFFAELPDNKKTKGKYVRLRSVEHVLEELKFAKKRYKNLRWIDFEDDIFTVDKKWLKEFLDRYKKEIDIHFQCLVHPRYIDEEIAQWLYAAGCRWVQMGVQSMDEDFKVQNLKRNEKSNHIENALKHLMRNGIKVKVDHMFGLPGEPITAQETARELYAEYCPVRIQTFWTSFLPGTEILEQGIREGVVSYEEKERLEEGLDFYFYRNTDNIKNPQIAKTYRSYELLFKLYPLLPKYIRKKLKVKHVFWIPDPIKSLFSFAADLFRGITTWNPDFIVYAQYYLFHITKFCLNKIGVAKSWVATTPKDSKPYILEEVYRHEKIENCA